MKLTEKLIMVLTAAILIISFTGTAIAQVTAETPEGINTQQNEAETVAITSVEKTLGQESKDALKIKITNNTGRDIVYFSVMVYDPDPMANNSIVRMQEALIEQKFLDDVADGSVGPKTQAAIAAFREANGLSPDGGADDEMMTCLLGPGYDGNLLPKEDVFLAGESRTLYIPIINTVKGTETAFEGENKLAEALKSFELEPQYVVSFRCSDQEKIYELYAFPAISMADEELCMEGETAYIQYKTDNSEGIVSMLDAEKAVLEAIKPPVVEDNTYDYSYDYGYDQEYDVSYDYGYEEPAYEEPVYEEPIYEEPYIVLEETYPSCDDGSHGVIYRVYSDGTEETIEY